MAQLTWQQFIKLPGISGLPLHEQKRKFIWENQQRFDRDLFTLNTAVGGHAVAASGTGGAGIDGPLNGATVTAAGISVTTNALGQFTFPIELTDQDLVVITGGTDSITGLPFNGELRGYISGSENIISPITTLAAYAVEDGIYDQYTDAVNYVIDQLMPALGFITTTSTRAEVLTKDFIQQSLNDNDDAIIAQAFATYIDSVADAGSAVLLGTTSSTYGELAESNVKSSIYRYIVNNEDISIYNFAANELTTEEYGTVNALAQLLDTSNFEVYSVLTNVAYDQKLDSNYRTTTIQAVNRSVKNTVKTGIENIINGITHIKDATIDSDILQGIIDSEKDSLAKIETTRENITIPTITSTKTLTESNFSGVSFKLNGDKGAALTINDITNSVSYYGDKPMLGTKLYTVIDDLTYGLNESIEVSGTKSAAWRSITEQQIDPVDPISISFYNWPTEVVQTGYDGVITTSTNPSFLPSGTDIVLTYEFTRATVLYTSTAPSSSSSYQTIGRFNRIADATSTRTELVGNFRIVSIEDDIIKSDAQNYAKYIKQFNQYFLVYESEKNNVKSYDVLFGSSYLTNTWRALSNTVSTGSFSVSFIRPK